MKILNPKKYDTKTLIVTDTGKYIADLPLKITETQINNTKLNQIIDNNTTQNHTFQIEEDGYTYWVETQNGEYFSDFDASHITKPQLDNLLTYIENNILGDD